MKAIKDTNKHSSEVLPINKGWEGFSGFNTDLLVNKFTRYKPDYFEKKGKIMAFELFHQMSRRVPAYKDFLSKNKINLKDIKNPTDMIIVPWIDKSNYLKQYSMEDLSWDGEFIPPIISASSGTSGNPTFWPRSWNIELETSYIYELFLRHLFKIDKYKTLLINGFAMGIYVGGTFTLNCALRLSKKGYRLTVVNPGVVKKEIIQCIDSLSPHFDQTIVGCYPPMLRDILEDAHQGGIDLKKRNIKLFFASESFSEDFRSYLYDKIGVGRKDYFTSSMNLYGTADAAIAGHETPLSIYIRKLLGNDNARCKEYFGEINIPSINMYYPFLKYYETIDGEIIISSCNNQIPLCKYNIHDRGGLINFDQMIGLVKSFGIHRKRLVEIINWDPWRLPYVYLLGRSDNSVKLYGALISPDTIRKVIEGKELSKYMTSKFTMSVVTDNDYNQCFEINLELKNNIGENKNLKYLTEKLIVNQLLLENIEYKSNYASNPKKQMPKIIFWKYEDPLYFNAGVKQKWVKEN